MSPTCCVGNAATMDDDIALFEGLSWMRSVPHDTLLHLIAQVKKVELPSGQIVFREGERKCKQLSVLLQSSNATHLYSSRCGLCFDHAELCLGPVFGMT